LALDSVTPENPGDVARLVQAKRVGDALPVLLSRAGQSRLLRVELEGTPEYEDRLRLAFVGRPAPEIAGVTTFQGETSSLGEVRGHVVVVEFWASWCGPCRFVSPVLDQWYRSYRPRGAEVIGITVDPPAEGVEIARHTGMSYTLAHDPAGRTTRSYLASQVPMLVLIDKRGLVRDVVVGTAKKRLEALEQELVRLLEEPA
jgi:thiol-disulfide isomerase/thioredoxin